MKDVYDFISTADADALSAITQMVIARQKQLARKNKYSFRTGSKVKFTSNKNGMTYVGIITDIRTSRCTVRTTEPYSTSFNVPLSFLKAA